jgi:hypothetical protein
MQHKIGFIYDKQGNRKTVYAPTTMTGKVLRKHRKTKTGALVNVGYAMTSSRL